MRTLFFRSAAEFRRWLEQNHGGQDELWIGFYKKDSGRAGISYQEAVDQALCSGWIDGVRKSIDEKSYMIRFTPRKAKSTWSSVNIRRVGELSRAGLMQPPGLGAFDGRDLKRAGLYSYEKTRKLDDSYERKFRSNKEAWDYFQSQPSSYRRVSSWWVMSAKREETRMKRLAVLVKDSECGRRLAMLTRRPSHKRVYPDPAADSASTD